jgi:glycosyltransferase involved in cell wall biosynthesis
MFGGGQRVVTDLGSWLRARGVPVRIILLGDADPRIVAHGDDIVPYDGRYNDPRVLFETALRLRRFLDRTGWPELLHTHGWDADMVTALARVGRSVPQLVHLHVTAQWIAHSGIKRMLKSMFTRWAFRQSATWLVAVSSAVSNHWVRLLPLNGAPPTVVHNGVDSSTFSTADVLGGVERDCVVFGVAARLVPMKGIDFLLDALSELSANGVGFECRIAGDGGLRSLLEQRAAALGIGERVRFLGHISDMSAFYRSIDVYVLSSVSDEGLPLGVLEAMASGLPVVASDVGGTREALRHAVTGYLVEARHVTQLVAALAALAADSGLRRRMGEAGRERFEEGFTLDAFGQRLLGLYSSMAQRKSPDEELEHVPMTDADRNE